MKLLLILGADESYEPISRHIKPLGFDLIRYRHVIKAMDNIDEIDPAAIIISARDFPRHWKILVQFIRARRSKANCPIIILKGEQFSPEENSQALFLGVSGIITEALENPEELDRLREILGRHIPGDENRKPRLFHAKGRKRFGLLIAAPGGKTIISGKVTAVTAAGLSFLPANPALFSGISLNTELSECSLRAGDAILSPVCRLVRRAPGIILEFVSFPKNEGKTLKKYLEEPAMR
jgi:DNA-binding response OmpR family regulator